MQVSYFTTGVFTNHSLIYLLLFTWSEQNTRTFILTMFSNILSCLSLWVPRPRKDWRSRVSRSEVCFHFQRLDIKKEKGILIQWYTHGHGELKKAARQTKCETLHDISRQTGRKPLVPKPAPPCDTGGRHDALYLFLSTFSTWRHPKMQWNVWRYIL